MIHVFLCSPPNWLFAERYIEEINYAYSGRAIFLGSLKCRGYVLRSAKTNEVRNQGFVLKFSGALISSALYINCALGYQAGMLRGVEEADLRKALWVQRSTELLLQPAKAGPALQTGLLLPSAGKTLM